MFKMGCSMAKKILAIDKQSAHLDQGASSSGSGSKKDKQHDSHFSGSAASSNTNQQTTGAGNGGAKGKTNTDELGDFSKLEQDPRIPLNIRQIFKITKSWKAIARTMSKTGTAMFLNLFEQNQDLFYLFDRFQHLKGRELHESMELREHASTVMATLDQSINSLSDYDNFVTYLHSIGKLHRKVPGFKRAHFWKIEQPFLKAVKQTLDERCNETIEEIYKIAIKLIIETIADGYGEDDGDLVAPNEGKDSSHGGGGGGGGGSHSNNKDNGNDENSRDPSGAHSNTRAKGNLGDTSSNKFVGQKITGRKMELVAAAATMKEELKTDCFVDSTLFHKRGEATSSASWLNRNRDRNRDGKRNKKKRKSRQLETKSTIKTSYMQNANVNSKGPLSNSHKQNPYPTVQVELNENSKQNIKSKKQRNRHQLESGNNESEENGIVGIVKQANCSTPSSDNNNKNNDLVTCTQEQQEHASALPLNQLPNDERLKETLFVLRGLLLSLMAKKEEAKNTEIGGLENREKGLNKPTLEAKLTYDERDVSLLFNRIGRQKLAGRDAHEGGLEPEDEGEGEEEKERSSSEHVSLCSLIEFEKDNKENCCKYREKFLMDNSTTDDRALQVCDKVIGNCRSSKLKEDEKNSSSLDENNRVICLIDQQPSLLIERPMENFTTTQLSTRWRDRGGFSKNIRDNTNINKFKLKPKQKRVDNSPAGDEGSFGKVTLAPDERPLIIAPLESGTTNSSSNFNGEKSPGGRTTEINGYQISCSKVRPPTKELVSLGTSMLESHYDYSENVNYNDDVRKEKHHTCTLASPLPPLNSTSASASASAPSLCHKESTKWRHSNEGRDEMTRSEALANTTIQGGPICSKFAKDIVRTSKAKSKAGKITSQTTKKSYSHHELPQNEAHSCFTQQSDVIASRPNLEERGEAEASSKHLDVKEQSTKLYSQKGAKFVCSLLTIIKARATKQAWHKQVASSPHELLLVNNHQELLEKNVDEGEINLTQAEEGEYKQTSDKEARGKVESNQFGANEQTKSFLMFSFRSHIKLSPLRGLFGIENSTKGDGSINKQRKRKIYSDNHHLHLHLHRQRQQQRDVSLETSLERPLLAPKNSGEHLNKQREQIKLGTASKTSKNSLLTTDLGDLGELIKMLMLTIASKRQYQPKQEKATATKLDININSNQLHV